MARPIVLTITGTGNSPWAVVDHHLNPFNIGLGAVVSGTVNYSVQHTYDNVLAYTGNPTAFTHETMTGLASNANSNYTTPVFAIRLTNNGSGTVTLTLIQSGIHS